MMGFKDWQTSTSHHGLVRLYNYSTSRASQLMTDPTYTRAIFVRDPKERITAAFQNGKVKRRCCIGRSDEKWCLQMLWHFGQFLDLIHLCDQPHWRPQGKRMEPKYFDTLNFVGHFGTMRQDARRLLKSIGAWVNFGKTGWNSAYRNDSRIFLGVPSNGTTYDFPGMKKCYGEVGVDYFYRSDYEIGTLNLRIENSFTCKEMSGVGKGAPVRNRPIDMAVNVRNVTFVPVRVNANLAFSVDRRSPNLNKGKNLQTDRNVPTVSKDRSWDPNVPKARRVRNWDPNAPSITKVRSRLAVPGRSENISEME